MSLAKWKKQFIFLTTACVITSTSSINLQAHSTTLTERPLDFIQLAKTSTPAVVSIKVEKIKNTSQGNSWGDFDDDASDSVEQFWHHFFQMPSRGKNRSEAVIGQASGFIVSPDGLIITNNHVVENTDDISVTLNDGTELPGKLIGQDNNTDIALIKIEGKNLPYLKLGNSDSIDVGQWVMAIGTPFGLQASVTAGIISAKGRNNLDLARIEDFIQTDAPINRGNSGGPLLNMTGDVIGVNTAIVGGIEGSLGGNMGIGFAVPSNIAKNVMDQLVSKGKVSRSFIGLDLQAVDHGLASAFGLQKPEGALVAQVVKASPAEKAGIKQGDIIVKLNDNPISSIGGFRTTIALMSPGSKIKLSLLREGKPLNISLETQEYPYNSLGETINPQVNQEDKLGISVTNLTPDLAQRLKYKEDQGVIVTNVDQGSLGQIAGLRKGSLIIAIDQKNVASVDEFKKELANVEKGKPILLLVKEGSSVRFISVKAR